jgi:hypothetical protein
VRWCGERRLRLTPWAFAVLRHLVEHRDRLVTKDDMLATVWRDTVVSDAAGEASASSARSPAPSLLVHRAPRAMRLKASDGPGPRHRLRPR